MKKLSTSFLLQFVFLFLFSSAAFSKIGVGVTTGKIVVDEDLRPGMSYQLPEFTIVNTGDEPSDYGPSIQYHQDQPEMMPERDWFEFDPDSFYLEPGKAGVVKVTLNIPIKAEPGEYFAYLEGRPMKKAESGMTTIGVAAAAKLYFTVQPANIFQAVYYKIKYFWLNNSPWTNIAAGVLAFLLILRFIKKNFNIKIQRTGKSRRVSGGEEEGEEEADQDE